MFYWQHETGDFNDDNTLKSGESMVVVVVGRFYSCSESMWLLFFLFHFRIFF